MLNTDPASEWTDDNVCHCCKVVFIFVRGKHHCIACGNVFCHQCSGKTTILPKLGIDKEVRVCDACYELATKSIPASNAISSTSSSGKEKDTELPVEYLANTLSQQNQNLPCKNENELHEKVELQLALALCKSVVEHKEKANNTASVSFTLNQNPLNKTEEEELQLALALSKSEAEHKEKEKMSVTSALDSNLDTARQPLVNRYVRSSRQVENQTVKSELARYSNPIYRESRYTEGSDCLASTSTSSPMQNITSKPQVNGVSSSDLGMDDFVNFLKSQLQIFINCLKSNSNHEKSITYESNIQSLFMNLTSMHSTLLHYIQQENNAKLYYKSLQDKLTKINYARASLGASREKHRQKFPRQAEDPQHQWQLQMTRNLDIMRNKKQKYLQYRRQLFLRRTQERKLQAPPISQLATNSVSSSNTASASFQLNQNPFSRTEEELCEEEELQLALALSKSEAEYNEKIRATSTVYFNLDTSSQLPVNNSTRRVSVADNQYLEPEIARFLNRSNSNSRHTGF